MIRDGMSRPFLYGTRRAYFVELSKNVVVRGSKFLGRLGVAEVFRDVEKVVRMPKSFPL